MTPQERLDALIAAIKHVMTTLENDPATLEMLQEAIDAAEDESWSVGNG